MPEQIQELIERMGGPRRVLVVAVGGLTTVGILALSHWAASPSWVPVFADLPIESVGAITQRLDEAGIEYRLERGGEELRVPATDLARARVTLASEGLPTAGRPGLELFDQPSWGMTDFAQKINFRRALEGELERTIGKMRGVESAQVHVAMRESGGFRAADRPAEASVVLQLRNGEPASAEVVQGVQHLVASSVDGLESASVAVLDNGGRLLSLPNEPGSLAAVTGRQLATQREVEKYLEAEVGDLVAQVVGRNNVRVRVAASMNFDRVERTTEMVNPDMQVVAGEQRMETPPATGRGAGSTNSTAIYENSRSRESYESATGSVRRLSVAVLVNHRLVEGPDAGRLEPIPPAQLTQIETLVRSAIGYDAQRGDAVSVVSLPFSGPAVPLVADEPAADFWSVLERVQRPLLALVGLLLAAFVSLRLIRTLQAPAPATPAAPVAAAPSSAGSLGAGAPPVRPQVVVSNTVMRDRVVATVSEHPNMAARLLRVWLKEA